MNLIPNLTACLHSNLTITDSIMNAPEYLMNTFMVFAEQWGLMPFVPNGSTAQHAFVNKGPKNLLGFPKGALKEEGSNLQLRTSQYPIQRFGK